MPQAPERFELVTEWSLPFARERVWRLIRDVDNWPSWWPMVRKVDAVARGDAEGIGAVRRIVWRTALWYDIAINMQAMRVEPMSSIEGKTTGDAEGSGLWELSEAAGVTHVKYTSVVVLSKPWMRWAAPVLSPVFVWNHHKVMERGRRGIMQALILGR